MNHKIYNDEQIAKMEEFVRTYSNSMNLKLKLADETTKVQYREYVDYLCSVDNILGLCTKGYASLEEGDPVYLCDRKVSEACLLKIVDLEHNYSAAFDLSAMYADGSMNDGEPDIEKALKYYYDALHGLNEDIRSIRTLEFIEDDIFSGVDIKNVIHSIDNCHKEMIYFLYCLKTWDNNMIKEIGPKVIPGFSQSVYEDIKKLFFVSCFDNNIYSIHSIVHHFFSSTQDKNLLAIRKKVVKEVIPYCKSKLDSEVIGCSDYNYHLNWLMNFGLRFFNENDLYNFFMDSIGVRLFDLMENNQVTVAEAVFAPFLEAANKYDEKSIVRMQASSVAADILDEKGDHEAALKLREQHLALCNELYGEKHIATIKAMNELVFTLNCLKRFSEALSLKEKSFALCKEVLGIEHSTTITTMVGLAIDLSYLGRFSEALPLCEEALKLRIKLLGERHSQTINTKKTFAYILKISGHATGA